MTSRNIPFKSSTLALVVIGAAWLGGPDAGPVRAAAPETAQAAPALVDPAILGTMSYRNLTVFSRGGRVTAVAGVESNQQLYYMGSTGGGVWRTNDAGATWTNISDGFFEAGAIGAIEVATSDPNVIYVGTGSACPRGNVSPGVGMYKSTDAGATWRHIGLRDAGTIGRIKIHPTNPNLVYAAVLGNLFGPSKERGVYRSRDGGTTWQQVHAISERTGAVDLTMDVKNPDTLIAAMWTVERKPWTIDSGSSEGGLFRTTNGGDTWTKLTAGLPKGRIGKAGVSISAANPQRVYAQIEAEFDEGGTFRSDDGGTSWTRTYTGRDLQQRAWYYTHVIADPVEPDTVYALNVGAFKSTDGGKTFTGNAVQSHSDHHDLWINPKNNKAMVEGNDGGATVKLNDAAWTGQNNQITSELYRLTVDTRWPYWVYGAQQDNSTIAVPSQGTEAPYDVGGGESGHIAVDPRDPGIVYAGNYGGTLSRTDRKFNRTENIKVYADSQTGQRAADMKYRSQWNAPIKISVHNPDVVYTTSQFVHRTTNAGLDWSVVSPDLTRNDSRRQQYSGGEGITRDNTGVEVYGTIFAIEESATTPGLIWAGSDDGLMHISRDNAKSWQRVTPADWPEGCINSIDPSVHDPGRAVVAMYRYRQGDTRPYAYLTNDYGKSWRRIADGTNGIPNGHFVRVVREDPARRGVFYAGTEYGMYVSFNDGTSWQPLQLNLPRTPVTDIKIYREDLILTTQGRGFWILDNMTPLRTVAPGATAAAVLFKPELAYRQGGTLPTFYYWLREAPTAPVTVEVSDMKGSVLFTTAAEPGTAPAAAAPGGGGRGGRGGGGGGGGRGAGAGAAPAGGSASAVAGMNRATWTNVRYPSLYTVPQRVVMWGGGAGPGQGPKVPPGEYRVKVSSGSWSETQTFRLATDPQATPAMTAAEGAEQLKLANEVGGMIKELYASVASIRDVRQQLETIAKSPAASAMQPGVKTLRSALDAAEGDLTQMQGEGGQDSLNFPGRLDNQLIVLYQSIVNSERRLGTPQMERYKDLKPPADKMLAAARNVLTKDVAAFNAAASKAGAGTITVK
jgi:photosystem II stability/assembly factor-like uncharacterized protein